MCHKPSSRALLCIGTHLVQSHHLWHSSSQKQRVPNCVPASLRFGGIDHPCNLHNNTSTGLWYRTMADIR